MCVYVRVLQRRRNNGTHPQVCARQRQLQLRRALLPGALQTGTRAVSSAANLSPRLCTSVSVPSDEDPKVTFRFRYLNFSSDAARFYRGAPGSIAGLRALALPREINYDNGAKLNSASPFLSLGPIFALQPPLYRRNDRAITVYRVYSVRADDLEFSICVARNFASNLHAEVKFERGIIRFRE